MFERDPAQTNSTDLNEASKLLHFKVLEHRLAEIWTKFADAGFEPLLIKGWAAAQLYPKPFERQFSDVDLAFDPREFSRAQEFLSRQKFPLAIDLHAGLRHLDTVSYPLLFERAVFKKCGDANVRIPAEEDHLRVLAVHWLNDGGAPRDRLRDVFYAVAARGPDFSWEKCLDAVDSKRRRWIICAIGLAHRYLDLPIEDLPFRNELNDIPAWLIRTVESEWASGVRLKPLTQCRHDRKQLWQQIKKRIPPNALQATIETEGDFDSYPRFYYQTLDIFKRLAPWLKRAERKV